MDRNSKPANGQQDRALQGEGNYDAARRFDAEQEAFARDKEKVERKAREAAEALDGKEAAALSEAERQSAARRP